MRLRTVSCSSHMTTVPNNHNNSILTNNALPQSTVCAKIMELLGQNKVDHRQRKVAIVSQDCFYKVLTPEQKAKALKGQYNFDHPGNIHLHTWPFCISYIG